MGGAPVAIYVHIPFCPSKCGYCDFNSYAMNGEIVDRTVHALISELSHSRWRGRPAKSIFFGGGTPTFLSGEQLGRILDAVRSAHPISETTEITSEANPGTVDVAKFRAMREAGFNRISLGAQSFWSHELRQLGRAHQAADVGSAVYAARAAGFDNINLDLMFGLPGQSMIGWRKNLEIAISLSPEHLSLYCLTIEPNTRYYRLHNRGMLDLPDEEAQVAMYDVACELAGAAGYEQVEISNFAKPGRECQHNLCYWLGEEYLGYGPGAVGCFQDGEGRTRYTNMKHPERYCESIEAGKELWCAQEAVDDDMRRIEQIMLGLRLNRGIQRELVEAGGIERCLGKGWLQVESNRVHLTAAGRHFCSSVCAELL